MYKSKYFLITLSWAILWTLVLVLGSEAVEIHISWDINTESDLEGYRVYMGDNPGGPYTRLNTSVDNSYTWKVVDPIEKLVYFVVTAYDTSGNESGYSNEANIYVDNVAPENPTGTTIQINISIVVP